MRSLRAAAILASFSLAALFAPACRAPLPIEGRLDHPSYYFDNTLQFQPNRIWRLTVSWEPYLLDDKKALLVKQYQFLVHGDADRRRLDLEIRARGGDSGYLRWLESELFPLGNWEIRDEAHVSQLRDMTLVSLRTKALKEVPKEGMLMVRPVWFPDPLLRALTDGCSALNWDVISRDESVGIEIVLKSRQQNPDAERWTRHDFDSPVFSWRQWSVGQEKSMSYRTLIYFKSNVARCPLPPLLFREFNVIRRAQRMGIDW